MGIQGSELAKGINIINNMLEWRLENEPDHDPDDLKFFDKRRTKIFLGYSSSMATGGSREIIRYLVEHRMIDSIVTTAGAVEDDIMRCFGDYISTSFRNNDDLNLMSQGYTRQGNILIPVESQKKFKQFVIEILKEMHEK